MAATNVGSSMRRTVAVTLMALAVVVSACSTSGSEVVERTGGLPSGAWLGARTTDEGDLRVLLVAAREFSAGNPCSADYTGSATETDDEVRVTITSRSPKREGEFGCTTEGHFRSVDVEVRDPVGARQVVFEPSGTAQEVYDGSGLLEPTGLAYGWSLLSEAPWQPQSDVGLGWQRTWGPPSAGSEAGACTPGPAPLNLTQGPSGVIDHFTSKGTPAGWFDVRGQTATAFTGGVAADTALVWVEGSSGMVLSSSAACAGDEPLTPEELARLANSLR
jgi:hypothetical protein